MAVSIELVKELRDRTQAPMLECKKVLEQTGGDMNQALQLLKERGAKIAEKKQERETRQGRIEVYVHPGNQRVAMVELNCETDFVARNEEFVKLARDIAMHITAMSPQYVRKEDVPEGATQGPEYSSPEEFYAANVLLEMPFVRDPSITVGQMIKDAIGRTGENIVVRRFTRYEVGA